MLVASMAGPGGGSVKEWGPDPIAALRSAAGGWIPLLSLSGPAGLVAAALGAVAHLLPHVLSLAAPLEGTAAAGAGLGGAVGVMGHQGRVAITAKKGSPLAPINPASPSARVGSLIRLGPGQPWALSTSAT